MAYKNAFGIEIPLTRSFLTRPDGLECVHILFWVGKDLCWMLNIHSMATTFGILALAWCPIMMVEAVKQQKFLELYMLFAVLGWLTSNFIWMFGETANQDDDVVVSVGDLVCIWIDVDLQCVANLPFPLRECYKGIEINSILIGWPFGVTLISVDVYQVPISGVVFEVTISFLLFYYGVLRPLNILPVETQLYETLDHDLGPSSGFLFTQDRTNIGTLAEEDRRENYEREIGCASVRQTSLDSSRKVTNAEDEIESTAIREPNKSVDSKPSQHVSDGDPPFRSELQHPHRDQGVPGCGSPASIDSPPLTRSGPPPRTLEVRWPLNEYFRTWRDYEHAHLLFWMGKDLAWNRRAPVWWWVCLVPTLAISCDFCVTSIGAVSCQGRNTTIEAVHHVAVLLWVLANGLWAFSDLFVKHQDYDDDDVVPVPLWPGSPSVDGSYSTKNLDGEDDGTSRSDEKEAANFEDLVIHGRWWATWLMLLNSVLLVAFYFVWWGLTCAGAIAPPPPSRGCHPLLHQDHPHDLDAASLKKDNEAVVSPLTEGLLAEALKSAWRDASEI